LTAAKLGGERFDLTAGFVERPGAVDSFGRVLEFFLDGKLSGDTAAGLRFIKATRNEALQLLLRFAPRNDEAVETFVNPGFDQQSSFHKGGVARALAFPFLKLAEDGFGDAGVNDGIQAVELGAIMEDDGTELRAVDAAIRCDNGRTEFLHDFVVSRLARLDKFVREGVGIENGEAHIAQHGSNGALAAGDSAGESKSQHFLISER
jgi:hypothetical protein